MLSVQISFRTFLCGLVLLLLSVTASAQFRASIQGTVTDGSGGLIPEATITVTNKETNKEDKVTTSSEGFYYRVAALAPGTYTVAVEKAGFKKKLLENVPVRAEATQGINITLEAGDVSAVVTVAQETARY